MPLSLDGVISYYSVLIYIIHETDSINYLRVYHNFKYESKFHSSVDKFLSKLLARTNHHPSNEGILFIKGPGVPGMLWLFIKNGFIMWAASRCCALGWWWASECRFARPALVRLGEPLLISVGSSDRCLWRTEEPPRLTGSILLLDGLCRLDSEDFGEPGGDVPT